MLALIFWKLSLLWITAHCLALTVGCIVASYLMTCSKGEFLWDFFENYLNEKLNSNRPDFPHVDPRNSQIRSLPWKGVTIPESVNELLEDLIEQLIDNYINVWYKTSISDDGTYQIRYAVAILYLRFQKIDLSSVILFEVIPLTVAHCEKIHHMAGAVNKNVLSSQMFETKILEGLPDVHFALSSRQNEVDYLRQLADHIVGLVVDESRIAGHSNDDDAPFRDTLSNHTRPWPSHVCRHFLRELFVFSFFLPFLDLIADPDTLNRMLVFLFDSNVLKYQHMSQKTAKVEILSGFTGYSLRDTPDSLLQLKLSDMLRDTRQLLIFRAYLNDIHASLNDLDFLIYAGDAHRRMLNTPNDDVALNELHHDVWQVFTKYIADGAPEKINMPIDIVCEFKDAVELHNFQLIDRCLEKAFQVVYKRMQCEYAIPFCQSECFLGNLCGSPPVSVDDLYASIERSSSDCRLLPTIESNYTLTQFRNRFWRMVSPTATDESLLDPSAYQLSDVVLSQLERTNQTETSTEIVQNVNSASSLQNMVISAFQLLLNIEEDKNEETIMSNRPVEKFAEQQIDMSNAYELPMFIPERDIGQWNITIPHIQPRRDPVTGHTMYVYVISVQQCDVKHESNETFLSSTEMPQTKWSIIRCFYEFYVLESKLLEFHGNMIKTECLPPRRPFNVKSRACVELHREHFEHFIQQLAKQPVLKHSDLLFVFLTTEREFKDSTQISDLYPWNVVKKMPSKFARERGQNLKPFILSLLATTLAPQPYNLTHSEIALKRVEHSETSSLSSSNPEITHRTCKVLQSDIYGNNCPSVQINYSFSEPKIWTRSLYDAVLFLLNRLFGVVQWPLWIIISIRHLMKDTIDAVVATFFRRFLNSLFIEANCIHILQFIQDSLFGVGCSATTDQEKVLRMELAERLTLEYLQEQLPHCFINLIGQKEFRNGLHNVLHIFQYPRLNKQLSYVYLDVIMRKLFPVQNEQNEVFVSSHASVIS
ncbi:unnamed protein product [Thelazia callipaeda]|uniref:Sorting nexin-13 n=1 Tax=Thelazia callipaeda TaxID=103827 RepID=A0A0N5D155_THECL|nr:unnamed protein product [Thelazia callipaeda]